MCLAGVTGGAEGHSRALSLSIGIAGAVWLVLVAWFLEVRKPFSFHDFEIYDLYCFAMLDERINLPSRTIRFEGWYTADGAGYSYHGIAPLLPRVVFGWAWPSIWFWAVLGADGGDDGLVIWIEAMQCTVCYLN